MKTPITITINNCLECGWFKSRCLNCFCILAESKPIYKFENLPKKDNAGNEIPNIPDWCPLIKEQNFYIKARIDNILNFTERNDNLNDYRSTINTFCKDINSKFSNINEKG